MFPGMGGMPPKMPQGFNPMSMMGRQGGNPMMAMAQQMMGGNPQMMQMMNNPQMQQAMQNIMSGNVSQGQMQNMLNQGMGKNAPNLGALVGKIQELKTNGEVIVINNQQVYQQAKQMGLDDIVRFSSKINQIDIMPLSKFESDYK